MAMLELYLIRHGMAAERGKDWPDDSKRPLTPDGISQLRKYARGLTALGVTSIRSSPARWCARVRPLTSSRRRSRTSRRSTTSDALAPAGTSASVVQEITKHVRKGTRRARRPRTESRRAGRAVHRRALAARIPEGRHLPHRLRHAAAQRARGAALVRDAEDAPQDRRITLRQRIRSRVARRACRTLRRLRFCASSCRAG